GNVVSNATSNLTLAIGNTTGSDLKINSATPQTTIQAIAINSANQKLEIGSNGNLTLGAAENISNGTIQLDGGSAVITDTANIVRSEERRVGNAGNVNANLLGNAAGNGTITANNGTLVLSGN